MATRILGPTGSKRRRRFLLVPILLVACTALLFVGSAQAVHDLTFQLDGDVSLQCFPAGAPGSGTNVPCQSQVNDWGGNTSNSTFADSGNGLFVVSHPTTATEKVCPNPALVVVDPTVQTGCTASTSGAFSAASFTRDFESGAGCTLNSTSTTFCTGDDTTYATGSKDTLGIGNGGWQCNHDSNVNSKIDIMNSYVGATKNAAGDLILYFGLEKNKSNGTNDVGVWFLRGDATCSAPSGHKNFVGAHQNGDVLVVSEFTAGGGVSTIKAFRWAANATFPGDSGCIDSHGNPNPATGGCDGKAFGSSQDCKGLPTGSTDILCATTNASGSAPYNGTVTTPWLTSDATLGIGHSIPSPDFIEGGINITQAFNQAGGGPAPSCFTVGIPDTRSSASVTATLFDFVINKLGSCSTSLSTKENLTSPASIGTGTVSSGTDTATLTITGTSTWGGTLTWYLCGPVSTDACDNHGVQITSRTVSNSSPSTDFVSGTANLTSAGRYCWFAHFEPDAASAAAGVGAADGGIANECFTVNPVKPGLTTAASCSATPCVTGSTLSDTATLTGTASKPGTNGTGGDTGLYKSINATNGAAADSSITWHAFGPNNCTTTAMGDTSRTVSGDGTYPTATQSAVSFVAGSPGTYTFVASYPGDSPNTSGADPVTCPDSSAGLTETVTVSDTSTATSSQTWRPQDTGSVSSDNGSKLNGTLSIQLYEGATCASGNEVSGQLYSTTLNGTTSTGSVSSNNTSYDVSVSKSVSWLVKFVSTDSNVAGSSHCEHTDLTIVN